MSIRNALYTPDLDNSNDLFLTQCAFVKKLSWDIKGHLHRDLTSSTYSFTDPKGVKIPHIDVPMFNGILLH